MANDLRTVLKYETSPEAAQHLIHIKNEVQNDYLEWLHQRSLRALEYRIMNDLDDVPDPLSDEEQNETLKELLKYIEYEAEIAEIRKRLMNVLDPVSHTQANDLQLITSYLMLEANKQLGYLSRLVGRELINAWAKTAITRQYPMLRSL